MARTAETTREDKAVETRAHEGAGLHLHTRTLHPPVPIPYITRDDVRSTAESATSRLPGRPSGRDVVFYGGLGALAVVGALEWPVALAVGGATWLVRSRGKGKEAKEEEVEAREAKNATRERSSAKKSVA
ncbi:hypothetical protein E0500_012500 [Streptomyces sp. KM273126]|uniref:hypothetical protein n=1 Tax=Streptomyces sp. KM273126 TaxID=2545247 RepID=UPI0015EB6141|nr:hypothetical protein [Streptomyces sp. KM273126]MBA2808208.1 hypothetical protein [Streptomyces sp. KM273126]